MASPSLSHGIHAISDADRLHMPGHDTRFAGGVLRGPAPEPPVVERVWPNPRAWLALLRRPTAQPSH